MSLLIVYEGDESILREALAAEAEGILNEDADDDGDGDESSDDDENNWGEGGEDGDGLGDGAGSKGKGERKGTTSVKLIDFAHSRGAKGEGRDEGVMKGMETSIRLVEGRLAEVLALAGPLALEE